MSADYPLLASIAEAYGSRLAAYVGASGATATLDGDPYDGSGMAGLPHGFYILRPDPRTELGDLTAIREIDAIKVLLHAKLIEPDTQH